MSAAVAVRDIVYTELGCWIGGVGHDVTHPDAEPRGLEIRHDRWAAESSRAATLGSP
ncbi:MAG: hypothetical protein S0880_08645 [Actinomycetota bacterium]|nr:hypothetical protein [Actinomycetota bacterium]